MWEQDYGINTDASEPGVPSNCDELCRPAPKVPGNEWGRKGWEVGRGQILSEEVLLLILVPTEENSAIVSYRCYPNTPSYHLPQE